MTDTPNGGNPVSRRGLFARLGAWWRGVGWPLQSPAETEREVSEFRPSTAPLVVPADGGVFAFTVHYEITYRSSVMSQAKLVGRIGELHTSAVSTVFNRIWPLGRNYLPHRPEDAERAMNAAVGREWCYDDNMIRCRAVVRVTADERVLTRQLPMWEQLIEMDVAQRVQLHRINQVYELLTGWIKLLEHFDDTPVAIQSATLADPELARAMDGLFQRRRATSQELATVLREAREAHAFVGLYEMANAYDVALREFERRAGLGGRIIRAPEDSDDPDESNGVAA